MLKGPLFHVWLLQLYESTIWWYRGQNFVFIWSRPISRPLRVWFLVGHWFWFNTGLTHKFKGINHFGWELGPFIWSSFWWFCSFSLYVTSRGQTRQAGTGSSAVWTCLRWSWSRDFLDWCWEGSLVFCQSVWYYRSKAHLSLNTLWSSFRITEIYKCTMQICLEIHTVFRSPASLRCGPWARHIYPSLVLVQPMKTRPYITERLLMGRKELNQTNKYCLKVKLSKPSECKIVIIYLSFSLNIHRGSYMSEYFIWNLLNEPLASLTRQIRRIYIPRRRVIWEKHVNHKT